MAFGDIDWNEFRRMADGSPKWTVPRGFGAHSRKDRRWYNAESHL